MTNFLSLIIITRQYREEKVVKISEIFTKGKVLWSTIKFSQLFLSGKVRKFIWRICIWILGLTGLKGLKRFHSIRWTYFWQAGETWSDTWYRTSMMLMSVSLSLASKKGARPQTSMNKITPRLQISERKCLIFSFYFTMQSQINLTLWHICPPPSLPAVICSFLLFSINGLRHKW